MKKVIVALVALGLLFGGIAACSMSVLGATIGSIAAICQLRPAEGDGTLVVTGDLPTVDGFTDVQLRNAAVIITTAGHRGLGEQGARIGLITAMQESGLRNLANAGKFTYPAKGSRVMTAAQWNALRPVVATSVNYPNDGVAAGDWDSIGMFQGRYSIATWSGDGSAEQKIRNLLNPTFTTARFYDALAKVTGWQEVRPAAAAQAVQRSAYPDAYDKHWEKSGKLLAALTGIEVTDTSSGPCVAPVSGGPVSADGWTKPITTYKALSSPYGMRLHPVKHLWILHAGQDFSAPRGTPIYAAAPGIVVKAGYTGAGTNGLNWVVIDHGGGVLTRYLHSDDAGILVKVGQQVTAGQQIATVGNSGFTTGAHLHFEVSVNGKTTEPMAYLAARGVTY